MLITQCIMLLLEEPTEINFKIRARKALRKGITIAGMTGRARSGSSKRSDPSANQEEEDDWYLGEWLLDSSDDEGL